MSTTPTPSMASGQTCYFDALMMQLTASEHGSVKNDSTGKMAVESSSADPLPASSGNPDGIVVNDLGSSYHAKEVDTPIRDAVTEAEPRPKTLPLESEQQEPASGIKTTASETSTVQGTKESVRKTRSTHNAEAPPGLANGGAPAGPSAVPNDDKSLLARSAHAERSLSQKQKNRIAKDEAEDTKRFSKLLRLESSTEKVALDSALKTLSSLQTLHKEAIKQERKAQTSYTRALYAAQKAESKFHEEKARLAEVRARAEARCMEERARWEGKEGEARAQGERLDTAKETIREVETRVAECAREVEKLRIAKATDEREREAKLAELAGQK